MSINIAFDFDGVCTDLSFVKEYRINTSEFLYSPISIFTCSVRRGIFELISVSGLFSNIFILTSRPSEAKTFIQEWLVTNQLSDFVRDIICCGGVPKIELMKKYEIDLLVDDESKNLPRYNTVVKGILWKEQLWLEVLQDILEYFVESQARFKENPKHFLRGFQLSTDIGASPVFILILDDQRNLKLRLCLNVQVRNRIVSFLNITSRNDYPHVSSLVNVNGLAILKTFIEGASIRSFKGQERLDLIFKTGIALAKLHAIEVDGVSSDLRLNVLDGEESLLVFSADNYNMIVTTTNEVVFIDLEACNVGSRWIDYCWAEEQLCQNDREKNLLSEGYSFVYEGNYPSAAEKKMAKLSYKLWLTYQLQQSNAAHISDSQKIKAINDALQELWTSEQS